MTYDEDDMLDEYDFDIAKTIPNPFKGKMKNGYDVLLHYGPKPDEPSTIDIIDDGIERITYVIYKKMHGIPNDEIENKLNDIIEAVKSC